MFDKRFLSLLDRTHWAFAFVLCLQLALWSAIQRSTQSTENSSPKLASKLWPEADQLFRSDPRWLGGDAAFSVDLGAGRVLWLFGDSFVARKAPTSREASIMVRNSVAIQTGYDPAHATLKFYWRMRRGQPADFAPPEGKMWFWPAHGIRLGDRLLLFYSRVATEHKKDSLGFRLVGWTAFLIENPDQEPFAWTLRKLDVPDSCGKIIIGASAVQIEDFLYVFGASEPEHDVYLVRWPVSGAARGQLLSPEWWWLRWLASELLRASPGHAPCFERVQHSAQPSWEWFYRSEYPGLWGCGRGHASRPDFARPMEQASEALQASGIGWSQSVCLRGQIAS
jgi:hypothetical protein